ncbi:ribonuclease E activity regulator RraA [Actinorugispora endophytica]|uniref:4-hydroxy-4-methyl-2-oxoglutarate aldolase n=1 Tax=Actinorugispora endophytica TaxID=1605990 RepID=A0A4R6V3W2_9ACTN|nr:ribonuclease E activity regulator RraA [Actinorugispora endophytica]TDQ54914.1 regulator of ribonuclease activity A [Actinorugispora endophytica]
MSDASEVFATADLIDAHGDSIASCETQFRQFGARAAFHGPIRTVKCHEDNALVRELLNQPGEGRVLVVDGGGSLRSALMGDMIAGSAAANGWSGVVINGAVRDVAELAGLALGVKALGSNPRKSAKAGAGVVDEPVAFGQVVFTPGAWLYSDADGIVVAGRELPRP